MPFDASSKPLKVSPFAAALDETSRVEIMPFRGKNIFYNTHYEDVGVQQSDASASSL